ncbi:MAG: hypothetical protein DWQ04_27460, partial [Chloroflexi bacterium]
MKIYRVTVIPIIIMLIILTLTQAKSNQVQANQTGPLSGKTIVISPGHGWYWDGAQWRLQRSYHFGVVEDFLTIDITQYLNEFLL